MGLDLRGVEQRLYDLGLCQGANTVPCTSKPPSSSCATTSPGRQSRSRRSRTRSPEPRERGRGPGPQRGRWGEGRQPAHPGRYTAGASQARPLSPTEANESGGTTRAASAPGAKGGVVLVLARLGRAHRRSTFRRAAALQARAARPASQRRPGRACAPAGEQTHWGTHAEQDRGVPGFQLHAPTVSGSPAGGCGGKAGSPVHESGTN